MDKDLQTLINAIPDHETYHEEIESITRRLVLAAHVTPLVEALNWTVGMMQMVYAVDPNAAGIAKLQGYEDTLAAARAALTEEKE